MNHKIIRERSGYTMDAAIKRMESKQREHRDDEWPLIVFLQATIRDAARCLMLLAEQDEDEVRRRMNIEHAVETFAVAAENCLRHKQTLCRKIRKEAKGVKK